MAKKMLDTCQNIASRPGDALMITVELTVYPHVPRACGGRGADLHRVPLPAAHLPKPTWARARQSSDTVRCTPPRGWWCCRLSSAVELGTFKDAGNHQVALV